MIRWICSAKLADRVSLRNLRSRLDLASIDDVLRWGRLRWFGHLQRMDIDTWPHKICTFNVVGANPRGRPRKRWCDNIKDDLKRAGLNAAFALDRERWRDAIRPKRHDADVQPPNPGNNGRENIQ